METQVVSLIVGFIGIIVGIFQYYINKRIDDNKKDILQNDAKLSNLRIEFDRKLDEQRKEYIDSVNAVREELKDCKRECKSNRKDIYKKINK